ncbi:unnamed protein product [Didymodactylos carnosus]|uniref:Uncharacterized protein n=1 Tax=Didymodactylos carnosus TaxID=1234261 RepID=A0A815UD35_9BILA|nr:unnamed protein product [Didymodactylos carnosus]CAF1516004.1 unnamed protein product [Didymodactylos carnosus]CAF4064413.1 unnamed protein product [Didymodactylos carnosus]CAF4375960.1 unnamed protein product [Didymodactylos carnosus]
MSRVSPEPNPIQLQPTPSFISNKTNTTMVYHNVESTAEQTPAVVTKTLTPNGISTISSIVKGAFIRPKWMTNKIIAGIITCTVAALLVIIIPIAVKFSGRGGSIASTTIIALPVVSAYWAFDNNGNELYGGYPGSLVGSASYQSGYTYFGVGYGLYMSTSNSYFSVSNYFNLSYQSFTVDAWIYPYNIAGDNPIFSQCTCSSCTSQCLFLILRTGKLYMGFTYNDLTGTTTLTASKWYHIAFVYNYQTSQQLIYVDGVLDASRSGVTTPYLGQNGSITMGYSMLFGTSAYYYYAIDNLALTTRAKSSSELLTTATLIFYFSFDLPSPYYDNGPNGLNSTNYAGLSSVSGRVNQGIQLTTSTSFFQMYGFYGIGLLSNSPFTFAVWINPTSINGGIIVHISSTQNGYWSQQDILSLTYSGQIMTQIQSSNSYYPSVIGPFISLNTWTHVACTFSTTLGLTLYVNGNSKGSSGAISAYSNSGGIMYVTLGYNFGQTVTNIASLPFQGAFDEFYTYKRELSASEVSSLANP